MSFKSISIFLIFTFITSPSGASSIKFNGLVLSNFWIKETIGNHKITSGYLTIENKNNFDERLETVTSEISEKTQLHNMVVKNDIMKMENLNNGIVIKAKSKIDLIKNYLNEIDLILIMSVEPGFGGQKFDPTSLIKIKELDADSKSSRMSLALALTRSIAS